MAAYQKIDELKKMIGFVTLEFIFILLVTFAVGWTIGMLIQGHENIKLHHEIGRLKSELAKKGIACAIIEATKDVCKSMLGIK